VYFCKVYKLGRFLLRCEDVLKISLLCVNLNLVWSDELCEHCRCRVCACCLLCVLNGTWRDLIGYSVCHIYNIIKKNIIILITS
jgi:hypothetical protein